MRNFFLLPTWLLMKCMPLPNGHIWKNNKPSYNQWIKGATDLCVGFGILFLSYLINLIILIIII